MKNLLTKNIGLKILAVLFSVILWLIVVNINDPVVPVSFYGIPVEIINADSITGQGKMYQVLDGTDIIDVTVRANRSLADSLSKDNIKAVADMEQLSFMDTVAIQLSSNKYNDKLESITSSTESLKVNIENMDRNQLVVSCETVGEPASGYMLGNITTDQNVVRLAGPESAISKVEKAVASVNVEGMSADISTAADLRLYDAEGNVIDDSAITKNISVIKVSIEILALAEIPLTVTPAGEPALGYAVSGESIITPATVEIAGKKSVMESIASINIDDVSVAGQSSNVSAEVNIKDYLPEGVRYMGDSAAKATVVIGIEQQSTKSFEVSKKNISFSNMPAGYKGTVTSTEDDDTVNVTLIGLSKLVNAINQNTLQGAVDISEYMTQDVNTPLAEGTRRGTVHFALPEGVTVSETVQVEFTIEKIQTTGSNTTSGNTAPQTPSDNGAAGDSTPADSDAVVNTTNNNTTSSTTNNTTNNTANTTSSGTATGSTAGGNRQ